MPDSLGQDGRSPSVWSLCMMYGFLGFSGNFYLTLLPTYLKHHRDLSRRPPLMAHPLPFAFGVVACLVGGSLSDSIIRRLGQSLEQALGRRGRAQPRRAGHSRVHGLANRHVGFLLTVAFFGNDLAMAPAWAAAADIGGRYTGVALG